MRWIVNNWNEKALWNLHVEAETEEEAVRLFKARWPEAPVPNGALRITKENENLWTEHGEGAKYYIVDDWK